MDGRDVVLRRARVAPEWERWSRPIALGSTLLLLAAAAVVWRVRFGAAGGAVAIDYRSFVDEGHRLLTAGTPYLPYQLAGTYEAAPAVARLDPATVPFLYPPPFALLGVALTALPAFLWWAVPLALLGYVIGWWRPAPWTWPILAAVLVWPATSAIVIVGGTTMWAAALTAGGLRWGWPSALILLKPSFLPLAAIGIRRRSWWITVGVLGLVSLAMLPLWGEYLTALGNATDVKPWYSLGDLPLVLAPLVAYAGRRTSPDLVTIVPDESGVSTDAEDTHSTPTPTPTPTSASA